VDINDLLIEREASEQPYMTPDEKKLLYSIAISVKRIADNIDKIKNKKQFLSADDVFEMIKRKGG